LSIRPIDKTDELIGTAVVAVLFSIPLFTLGPVVISFLSLGLGISFSMLFISGLMRRMQLAPELSSRLHVLGNKMIGPIIFIPAGLSVIALLIGFVWAGFKGVQSLLGWLF